MYIKPTILIVSTNKDVRKAAVFKSIRFFKTRFGFNKRTRALHKVALA